MRRWSGRGVESVLLPKGEPLRLHEIDNKDYVKYTEAKRGR